MKTKEKTMKRTFVTLILIALFFLPSLACGSLTTDSVVGSGEIINQILDVSNFDRVTLEGFGNVFIEQGQAEGLSVQTDENIFPLLDIRLRDKELILGVKKGFDITPSRSIIFNLTVLDLNQVTLAGSGTFEVGPVESKDMTVSLLGSGDINIRRLTAEDLFFDLNGSGNITIEDINAKTVDTSLQGSGDIRLDGKTHRQKVSVAGSGNILAGDLETTAADISIPGSGNITIWISDELAVQVNGSGDIRYYGQPTIKQSGAGSGDLIPLGDK
jgi:hypothetical protein